MRPSPVNDWNGMHLTSLMMDAINNEWYEFWHVNRMQVTASYETDVSTIESNSVDSLIVTVVSCDNRKGLVVWEDDWHDTKLALKIGTCCVLTSRLLSDQIERYLEGTI